MGQQQLGLIRFPSTFQRPPAAPSEAAAAAGGAVQTKNERTPILSSVSASSSSSSSRLVGLKQGSLATQLMSEEFVSATLLLTVASFWANFYIGAVDLQVVCAVVEGGGGVAARGRDTSCSVLRRPTCFAFLVLN